LVSDERGRERYLKPPTEKVVLKMFVWVGEVKISIVGEAGCLEIEFMLTEINHFR